MAAVYWIGSDGNIYLKGAAGVTGVQNLGKAPATMGIDPSASSGYGITDNWINLPGANYAATRIADPNPGGGSVAGTPAPGNPTGVTSKPLNTAAVANTQTTIDQIPALLQAALASEDQSHANTINTFNQQEQTQTGAHEAGTVTNQNNYDYNFMDSIRAGIKGLGGLMAILRGSGAAGGTVDDTVRDTVGGITADDVRSGKDTHDQNQGALDNSLASFMNELKGKRQVNEDTYVNNTRAINRDSNTQLQDLYSKMAGFYGDAGDTGSANSWMARAGGLTPTIAANTRPQTSAYDTTPVVVHAPNLTAFAAPTQPDAAVVPGNGQVGSGIFTISNNKRKDTSTPAVVAPAPGA